MASGNPPSLEFLPPLAFAPPRQPASTTPSEMDSSHPFAGPSTPKRRHTSSVDYSRTFYRPPSRRSNQPSVAYSSDYNPHSSSPSMRSSRPMRFQDQNELDDELHYDQTLAQDSDRPGDTYTRRPSRSARPSRYPPQAFLNRPYHQPLEPPLTSTPTRFSWDDGQSQRPLHPKYEENGLDFDRQGWDSELGGRPSGLGPRVDWKSLSKEERSEVLRLPWTQWMNSDFKNHFVAFIGEFTGTTMFLLFAFAGTEVANIQSAANGSDSTTGAATGFDVNVLMYIALSFGFSLMVNVWVFFRISGGLFNPAVTFGMLLVRAITPARAACLFVAQILGSMLASVVVLFLLPENFNVRTTLTGGATVVQGVLIEAVLTAELVFTIFMLAKEKHRATFIAPVGIGLALFVSELVGVQFTGGSLNPARSFGPCVVTLTFDQEHWIYWVGPFLGALVAVIFYKFIKILEYEMANPGADGDPLNDPTQNPEKMARLKSHRR
ncbi:aquaporin-1 [Xylariomycetidae sp. FL2044]|nr:aquaporin-1 [Xylariomycetidae sp. FL2044]